MVIPWVSGNIVRWVINHAIHWEGINSVLECVNRRVSILSSQEVHLVYGE